MSWIPRDATGHDGISQSAAPGDPCRARGELRAARDSPAASRSLRVRPARPADAEDLAWQLRAADLREIQAATGETPLEALRACLACSEAAYAVIAPGPRSPPIAGLFGAAPHLRNPDHGIVWLLGTDELKRRRFAFLRRCRTWIERLHRRFRVLGNFVDERNVLHVRWLEWCGFTCVRRLDRYGFEQRPFLEFQRRQREPAQAARRWHRRPRL